MIIKNDLYTISISALRKLQFFNSAGYKEEPITFKYRNAGSGAMHELGTIMIRVSIQDGNWYTGFEYTADGIDYCYQVELVQLQSNLGKGFLWYFLCPELKVRCRKLYFYQDIFVSRKCLIGGLYKDEAKTKSSRGNSKLYNQLNRLNKIILEGRKPSFKRYYRGNPTKRYLALMNAVRTRNQLNTVAMHAL